MASMLKRIMQNYLHIDPHDVKKVWLLSAMFFLLVGAYTVTLQLKAVVFTTIVGADKWLLALAKVYSMVVLVPAIFLHSRLVDLVRRHTLLYVYSALFGVLGCIFVYYLGHPTIGLPNNISSPDRLFGWFFYFFIEGYTPLVISVFWAFANSITKPQAAKNNYPLIVAGSKLGGIVCAGLCCLILLAGWLTDTENLQLLLAISTAMLAPVPLVVYNLVTSIPHDELHGYEAGYQLRQEARKKHVAENRSVLGSMLAGLLLMFEFPYVMGIFGMGFFFEMVFQALKVENIIFVKSEAPNLSHYAFVLLGQELLIHVVSFVVVLFGTRALITSLGERKSLLVIPAATGVSVLAFLALPSYATAIFAFVITRSVHYAFSAPLMESLYIPTVKEIQFKSKTWIEGFGKKFAKTCAQSFNMYTTGVVGPALVVAQAGYFGVLIGLWLVVAYALGWRFEYAVSHNEVIGASSLGPELDTPAHHDDQDESHDDQIDADQPPAQKRDDDAALHASKKE